ncbi:hypothetical protein [Mycolicibacterium moriokaense]|uniref:Uncharacterized protein n=1 Tax=Mycolicibacterium moriokaense TaxID=39691 RepID=A0A318HPZ3_9MYCO|nr:hypothetical protein [Mycolicibacterium moriokaense]PXX06362.1 hypothetical protein C8E89_114135 [Mycolicibacterium moriokaense]
MTVGDPAQPMIDWLNSVPVADLAAELMAGVGPSGVGDHTGLVTYLPLVDWLFQVHGYPKPKRSQTGRSNVPDVPITEAMALLANADLIYVRNILHDGVRYWAATRFGLAVLASGKAAVRQRIKDRTGL